MRQAVLVVVLVGAAFLGGAFVNGPGLRWVQTQVLGSMGLDDGGEIATVDVRAAPGSERANPASLGPVMPVPAVLDEPAPKAKAPDARPSARPEPSSPGDPPELLPPSNAIGRTDGPPRDPDVTRAATAPAPALAPKAPAPDDRPARPSPPDSLSTLMPAPAPAPTEGLAPPAPMPAPVAPAPSPAPRPAPSRPADPEWATLARKMQDMGVSRYMIEGQPGGRAVFSCLIPLAGRQAVTQRFEADGDDAVQAARATLRRVALWRASQPSPSPAR